MQYCYINALIVACITVNEILKMNIGKNNSNSLNTGSRRNLFIFINVL